MKENNIKNIHDDTLLLIKSKMTKEQLKKLAKTILIVVSKHGYASCRCIGAGPVYNTTKATIIANFYLNAQKNIKDNANSLLIEPSFSSLEQENITAITLKVKYKS